MSCSTCPKGNLLDLISDSMFTASSISHLQLAVRLDAPGPLYLIFSLRTPAVGEFDLQSLIQVFYSTTFSILSEKV